jgi:hypothetical protein
LIEFFQVFPSLSVKKEWEDFCEAAEARKSEMTKKFEKMAAKHTPR